MNFLYDVVSSKGLVSGCNNLKYLEPLVRQPYPSFPAQPTGFIEDPRFKATVIMMARRKSAF